MFNNLPCQDQASQPRSTNPNEINKRNVLSTTALNAVNNLHTPQCTARLSSRQKFKMATVLASTTTEWEDFFDELINLMNDYELFYDTSDSVVQENIVIRLESAVLALQQVIALVIKRDLECASVLQEMFRSIRILFLDWIRKSEPASPCSNLAIYSLEIPKVERTGHPGRPKLAKV